MEDLIRVGLVDSDDAIRLGRKLVLQSSNSVVVALESDSATDILQRFADYLIDVLVIDQRLRGSTGLEVLEQISKLKVEHSIETRLLLTAPFGSPRLDYEALSAGATAVVTQDQGADVLLETVQALATRRRQYSLRSLERLSQQLGIEKKPDPALNAYIEGLPGANKIIIEGVTAGESIRAVSELTGEPPYRVRKTVQAALSALGLATLEQLQLRVIRAQRSDSL